MNKKLSVLRQFLRQNRVEASLALRVRQQVENRIRKPMMLTVRDVDVLAILSTSLRTELHFSMCKGAHVPQPALPPVVLRQSASGPGTLRGVAALHLFWTWKMRCLQEGSAVTMPSFIYAASFPTFKSPPPHRCYKKLHMTSWTRRGCARQVSGPSGLTLDRRLRLRPASSSRSLPMALSSCWPSTGSSGNSPLSTAISSTRASALPGLPSRIGPPTSPCRSQTTATFFFALTPDEQGVDRLAFPRERKQSRAREDQQHAESGSPGRGEGTNGWSAGGRPRSS